jgi:phosphopantothenoylcysteine synthetase/decarboxylase
MRTRLILTAAAAAFYATIASAAITTDQLVSEFQAQGYTFIEVTKGLSQYKVEAVKGTEKIEVIYDAETGAILKSEMEAAGDDAGRTGVQVRERDRNFVRNGDDDRGGKGRGRGRDDDDDDRDDDDDDRDDDRSGRGGDDDDDDDDDSSGRGSDDD